jgi:hypothetical protein
MTKNYLTSPGAAFSEALTTESRWAWSLGLTLEMCQGTKLSVQSSDQPGDNVVIKMFCY